MSNKFAFGQRSMYNQKDNHNNTFYFGKVDSTIDEFDGGTIRARIKGLDDHIVNATELPSAFPLLQKFFHVTPKVGETVMVFIPDTSNPYADRVYIGPIISQPQNLYYDKHFYTSRAMMGSGFVAPKDAPSTIPENLGVHPKKEDVALQGRQNSDVILRKNEVVIRAGKFETTTKKDVVKKFNKKNPAYIQLKHDVTIEENNDNEVKGTVANVVASKINLLTHEDGQPRFRLNDQTDLITEDEILKILDKAHPLAFGDLLVEYLKLQRQAFINHVHPYHGKKPQDLAGSEDIDKYLEFDINRILSKNIRIN
jgi:hypothetical protein